VTFHQHVEVWLMRRMSRISTVDSIELLTDDHAQPYIDQLQQALALLADLPTECRRAVVENVRTVIVSNTGRDFPLAPYGACFIRPDSAVWRTPANLVALLVWVAVYVGGVRIEKGRPARQRAKQEADDAWHEVKKSLGHLNTDSVPPDFTRRRSHRSSAAAT